MLIVKKWAKVTALALSFPSTIFGAALFFKYLADQAIISKTAAALLFLFVVVNTLVLIIIYTLKKKRNDENAQKNQP